MPELDRSAVDLLTHDVVGGYLAAVCASLTLWAVRAMRAVVRRRAQRQEGTGRDHTD